MPQTKTETSSLTIGLALFSMFFGAGNIIFPLLIGKATGVKVGCAILGLGITAVILPFLGLAAMIFFDANIYRFFNCIGKIPGMLLLLLLQLILGPCGVIPRLVTLMHATAKPYLGELSLLPFTLFAAFLIFGCTFKKEKLLPFLGKYCTPLLLFSLAALIFFGIISPSSVTPLSTLSSKESFTEGFIGGYNMMDLIAALLFATVVFPYFQKKGCSHKRRFPFFKRLIFSILIAASLLFLTYIGLSLISAKHSAALAPSCPPEAMLGLIATKILGQTGAIISAIAILIACLTTAVSLVSIFAEYLRSKLCREKITAPFALVSTLIITTLFANLGFGGLMALLVPLLKVIYPGLILITLWNVLTFIRTKKATQHIKEDF